MPKPPAPSTRRISYSSRQMACRQRMGVPFVHGCDLTSAPGRRKITKAYSENLEQFWKERSEYAAYG